MLDGSEQEYCHLEKELAFDSAAICSAWSKNGQRFAVLLSNGQIYFYDLIITGVFRYRMIVEHGGSAHSISWNSDGSELVSASADRLVFWNTKTGDKIHELSSEDGKENTICCDWAPKRYGSLAYATNSNRINIVNHEKKEIGRWIGHFSNITVIKFHDDGNILASGTEEGVVGIWRSFQGSETDPVDNQLRLHYTDHHSAITSLAWLPRSDIIASASKDNRIVLRNTKTNKLVKVIDEIQNPIIGICFDPSGRFLVVKVFDNTIRIIKLADDLTNYEDCDGVGAFLEIRELQESGCIDVSKLDGNPRHGFLSTVAGLPRTKSFINLWKIDYDELLIEHKWAKVPFRSGKIRVSGFNSFAQDKLLDYLHHENVIDSLDVHHQSLGKLEIEIKNNVQEIVEPVLWWENIGSSFRNDEGCRVKGLALNVYPVDVNSLFDEDSYSVFKQCIERLRKNLRCPSIIPILYAVDLDETVKQKKEFEIRDIYESASIVWVDTRRCDFGEGFTDRVVGTINWDVQPRADSFSLLLRVENFYRGRKNDGYISSYLSEDYRQFREYNYIKTSKVLSELAFSLCVECLDCVGAIKRFPKGSKSVDETVCLNTSIMLHYMQAMFSAASDDKIGRLAEEQCYAGDFVISDNFKIDDRLQEVCLVSSILSLLEDMNLIYSMCSGEGAFWMFPSESEVIEYDGEGELITTTSFEIDGSVKDAYSYSVTKLFGSVIFHDPLLYKNLAIFSSIGGGQCGIKYRAVSPESGELLLCFSENSSANTIEIFTSFVKKNLDDATFINRISEKELVPSNQLASINSQAVEHRGSVDRGTDLFICYNSKDFENVRFIAKELELRDVNVWYDRRLLPGDSVQSVLAKQLREAKAVLILLGADGLGAWQNIEINLVLQQAVECNVRVIPGILPNFTDPSPPGFLNTYQYVDFRVLSANPIDEIANVIFTDCNNENQLKSERQVISLPNERT